MRDGAFNEQLLRTNKRKRPKRGPWRLREPRGAARSPGSTAVRDPSACTGQGLQESFGGGGLLAGSPQRVLSYTAPEPLASERAETGCHHTHLASPPGRPQLSRLLPRRPERMLSATQLAQAAQHSEASAQHRLPCNKPRETVWRRLESSGSSAWAVWGVSGAGGARERYVDLALHLTGWAGLYPGALACLARWLHCVSGRLGTSPKRI